MSEGLHGGTLAKKVLDPIFGLNLKHLDSDGGLPPEPLVNNAIAALRNLTFHNQFPKLNLHTNGKSPGFYAHFSQQISFLSFINIRMGIFCC